MKKSCPTVQKAFHRLVNMSPGEILRWAKDPRAKCASFEATRRRLPHLAKLKGKKGEWDGSDCNYAKRVVSFNVRSIGQSKKFGCTVRAVVAQMNWGHRPRCPPVPKTCKRRPPRS